MTTADLPTVLAHAAIWLVPTLMLCAWMRWDYVRKVDRPARVSTAMMGVRGLDRVRVELQARHPELAEIKIWQAAGSALTDLGRPENWEQLASLSVWRMIRTYTSIRFFTAMGRPIQPSAATPVAATTPNEIEDFVAIMRAGAAEWPDLGPEITRHLRNMASINLGTRMTARYLGRKWGGWTDHLADFTVMASKVLAAADAIIKQPASIRFGSGTHATV